MHDYLINATQVEKLASYYRGVFLSFLGSFTLEVLTYCIIPLLLSLIVFLVSHVMEIKTASITSEKVYDI